MAMRITIIGLGLIGGSLGMALRRAKVATEIVGYNRSHENAGKARQRGAIDRAEWNLPAAVSKSDVVIIATQVGEVETIFRQIAEHLPQGCVVTDVAGTKRKVMEWANEILPPHVSFVGGHPMAGKEVSGIDAASPDLFAGCTYCLTPARTATAEAVDRVASLVSAVGANAYFIDSEEHDSLIAAISHLPFVAATSLVNTVNGPLWRDMARLAATGFRDTTRLASGNPAMHSDVCRTNKDSILRWLDAYIAQLTTMRALIEEGRQDLEEAFRKAKNTRDTWIGQSGDGPTVTVPGSGQQIRQMLLGNLKVRESRKK